MNINLSNGNVADNTMATMFPRLYMAINIIKLILVIIVLYIFYRLNTSSARDRAAQETQRIINLRNAQLAAKSGQQISTAQGFRGY